MWSHAFTTPEMATMLLVSRSFFEGAWRYAVCVYVSLVKMMKCPNKDIASIPFLLKSKHCWAFYFLSLARSNPVTPRRLTVLEKPEPRKVRWRSSWHHCLTPRTEYLLCKGRRIYLFVFLFSTAFPKCQKKRKSFWGPQFYSSSANNLNLYHRGQHPSRAAQILLITGISSTFTFRNANPVSTQMFEPSELSPVKYGGTIAESLPTPTSRYPHLGGSNKPCTGTSAGIFLWSHPY